MDDEILDVFDGNMNLIGAKKRQEVHRHGDWHQTFHCWVLIENNYKKYLLFQIRSDDKDTYPNYFDVSSAGHLLTKENPEDGVRELEEELGISISIEDLLYLGTVRSEKEGDTFIDREFNHVYLYKTTRKLSDFRFQRAEIKGLSAIPLEDFKRILLDNNETLVITIEINETGEIIEGKRRVTKKDFVPFSHDYYNLFYSKFLGGIENG